METEEKSEEAQPKEGQQVFLEQENDKREELVKNKYYNINEKQEQLEEQLKKNQLKKLEEEKLSIEEKKGKDIANDQLNNAFIGGNENDSTKKSKFPTWAKYLIGLGILAVAVLALLFGFGVLGTVLGIAAVGTAKTVALVVAVLALFAELIYLAVLYAMSQDNENSDGRSSGAGFSQIREGNELKKSLLGKGKNIQEGKGEDKTPSSDSKLGITGQYLFGN